MHLAHKLGLDISVHLHSSFILLMGFPLWYGFPSLAAKNIINLILGLTTWWCPCVESCLVLLKRVFTMTSVFSWQNSIRLCPASFCTPRPNLSYLLTNLPIGLTDWTTPPATFQTFSKAWFSFHIPEGASQHGVKHLCALATTGCSLGCHTCRAPISPNPRSPLTWDSWTRAGKGPGNEQWTNKPPPTRRV